MCRIGLLYSAFICEIQMVNISFTCLHYTTRMQKRQTIKHSWEKKTIMCDLALESINIASAISWFYSSSRHNVNFFLLSILIEFLLAIKGHPVNSADVGTPWYPAFCLWHCAAACLSSLLTHFLSQALCHRSNITPLLKLPFSELLCLQNLVDLWETAHLTKVMGYLPLKEVLLLLPLDWQLRIKY